VLETHHDRQGLPIGFGHLHDGERRAGVLEPAKRLAHHRQLAVQHIDHLEARPRGRERVTIFLEHLGHVVVTPFGHRHDGRQADFFFGLGHDVLPSGVGASTLSLAKPSSFYVPV